MIALGIAFLFYLNYDLFMVDLNVIKSFLFQFNEFASKFSFQMKNNILILVRELVLKQGYIHNFNDPNNFIS